MSGWLNLSLMMLLSLFLYIYTPPCAIYIFRLVNYNYSCDKWPPKNMMENRKKKKKLILSIEFPIIEIISSKLIKFLSSKYIQLEKFYNLKRRKKLKKPKKIFQRKTWLNILAHRRVPLTKTIRYAWIKKITTSIETKCGNDWIKKYM